MKPPKPPVVDQRPAFVGAVGEHDQVQLDPTTRARLWANARRLRLH